jgi:hypothetical protein
MKKFGEPCVECIGFTICAPDIACNSQPCNFFRKAFEGVQTQTTNSQSDAIAALITELESGIGNTPAINLVLVALNRLRTDARLRYVSQNKPR